MRLENSFKDGHLSRITPDRELAGKELAEGGYDLEGAQKAFEEKDFKWATVKAYYSMFHNAKAILFILGIKERAHFAVGLVLEDLAMRGKVESKYADYYKAGISLRERADYHYAYSEESARELLEMADEFAKRMGKLAREIK